MSEGELTVELVVFDLDLCYGGCDGFVGCHVERDYSAVCG